MEAFVLIIDFQELIFLYLIGEILEKQGLAKLFYLVEPN